jgi:hypothetical protein
MEQFRKYSCHHETTTFLHLENYYLHIQQIERGYKTTEVDMLNKNLIRSIKLLNLIMKMFEIFRKKVSQIKILNKIEHSHLQNVSKARNDYRSHPLWLKAYSDRNVIELSRGKRMYTDMNEVDLLSISWGYWPRVKRRNAETCKYLVPFLRRICYSFKPTKLSTSVVYYHYNQQCLPIAPGGGTESRHCKRQWGNTLHTNKTLFQCVSVFHSNLLS